MPDKPEWQTIESAPKDGTHILVYIPDAKREVTEVKWMGSYWRNSFSIRSLSPIAWMPLPPPPTSTE